MLLTARDDHADIDGAMDAIGATVLDARQDQRRLVRARHRSVGVVYLGPAGPTGVSDALT